MPREIMILFGFFNAFVLINFATYFCLQFKLREKLFRELTLYWLLVFTVYALEAFVHQGKLPLSLVFITNLAPIYMLANFLMRSYGLKLNGTRYIIASISVCVLAIFNNSINLSFTTLAMPIAIVCSFPFVEAIYATFVTKKKETTLIQQMMAGIVFTTGIICCLNYAVNRMTPGTELLGFGTGFLTYITASIILPVFTIQEINKERTQKLEQMVRERTEELSASKRQKEKLLRVVVHDISNALQVLVLQNGRLTQHTDAKVAEASLKMMRSIDSICDITKHVREMESLKTRQLKLTPVSVQDCLLEVKDLFDERFLNKNIKLSIVNKVPEHFMIKVDRVSFIHSVVSNIISNALKFSYSGSEVHVSAYELGGQIYFDVQDHGMGMPESTLAGLFDHDLSVSVPGTAGERGTGLGMPLVKNYAELFGGEVKAFSTTGSDISGTRIVVKLPVVAAVENFTSGH